MMKKEEKSIILKKLFNYDCSGEELKQLLDKLDSKEEQDFLFVEAERLWKKSEEHKNQFTADQEKIFAQILAKIQQIENTKTTTERKISFIKNYLNSTVSQNLLKIAAILVIAVLLFVGGYSVLHHPKQNTLAYLNVIKVPRGIKKRVVLPDNTTVWLNAESTLKYPQHFGKTRTVYLTGEAYFEVTKDAKHPFIVSTPEVKVKVLGTGFDVSAYPEDKQVKTTLVHGKVMVYQVNGDGLVMKKAILLPGEQSVFWVAGKTFSVKKVNTNNYTAWRNGKLIFKDTPLSEVIKQIDRWYNVKTFVHDEVIEQFDYTVQFDKDSLNCVLKVLQEITPIRIIRSGRKIFVTRDKRRWKNFVKNNK